MGGDSRLGEERNVVDEDKSCIQVGKRALAIWVKEKEQSDMERVSAGKVGGKG